MSNASIVGAYALVIGVEKVNLLDTEGVTHALATCSYWPERLAQHRRFGRHELRQRPQES